MDEVFLRITERSAQVDTLNFELRCVGQEAIKNALTKLSTLASGEQRVSGTVSIDGTGKARESESLVSDDLEAAKALAKFGLDALKLAKVGGAKADAPPSDPDLFDATANPWLLRKIE